MDIPDKKAKAAEYFCMVFTVTVMAAASELFGEKEIIFPEIAAIGTGCFLSPSVAWKTDALRMTVCVTLCAFMGMAIVCFVPAPLWLQLLFAYMAGQAVLMFSGTTFAPMISAAALPVLLQTDSLIYPVSALLLTAMVALIRVLLVKCGVKSANVYEPLSLRGNRLRQEIVGLIVRSVAAGIGIWLCTTYGMKFCAAPPLLVAFTELCKKDCPAGKRRAEAVMTVTMCAIAGTACRYILVMHAGAPSAFAAALAASAVIIFMTSLKMFFPPAGAMALLAFLVPEEHVLLYGVEVFTGITAAALVSKLILTARPGAGA